MKNQQLPADGIYFKMPAEEYFALPYFSRSLAQKVRFSGKETEYYIKNSTKETPAMALGTAIHSMFLEPEDFENSYVKAPALTDAQFAGKKIIQTVDDLKPYLDAFGLKKSGKKEDLINSLRGYLDPAQVVIWDDVMLNFERENLIEKRNVLSDEDFTHLQNIREEFSKQEYLPETLQNGRSEVVIIWKDAETGVMCKCRIDYIQPLAITDVKSYSVKDFNTPLLEQLRKKIIWSSYNFQYAIYAEALETAINAIKAGTAKIHGEDDAEWIAEFLQNPIKQFFVLYVRTQAPYQMLALELQHAEVENAGVNTYYSIASEMWRNSIKKYSHFLKTGKWFGEQEINVLKDLHVPNAMWQATAEDC